jgi:hypothetical protein
MGDDKIFRHKEINTNNIIGPSSVDLSKYQHCAFELLKKKRWEKFEVLRKRQVEEDLEVFPASLKKDL